MAFGEGEKHILLCIEKQCVCVWIMYVERCVHNSYHVLYSDGIRTLPEITSQDNMVRSIFHVG